MPLQRVELRPAVAEETVGIDDLQDLGLLLADARAPDQGQTTFARALREAGDDRRMRHIRSLVGADAGQIGQFVEIVPPCRIDGAGIFEIFLVELLHIRRVRTEQIGV